MCHETGPAPRKGCRARPQAIAQGTGRGIPAAAARRRRRVPPRGRLRGHDDHRDHQAGGRQQRRALQPLRHQGSAPRRRRHRPGQPALRAEHRRDRRDRATRRHRQVGRRHLERHARRPHQGALRALHRVPNEPRAPHRVRRARRQLPRRDPRGHPSRLPRTSRRRHHRGRSLFTLVLMQGAAMHDNALGPTYIAALKPLFVQALDALLPPPTTEPERRERRRPSNPPTRRGRPRG